MATTIKTLVSKKKQRYVEDGYNLDLSYINDRVIAMGFPAENLEALYRNSMDEVKKFLDDKHANHYMIYNLCSEKIYDKSKFHGRVKHFPFDDHHPPNFSLIGPFCEDVHAWLAEDERNVAAVHCKAGKGRTGVMICCYLLFSGQFNDAQGVLDFYGQKRTMDEKGVTIPSQRRYIHYYDRLLRRSLVYKTVKLYLRCIVLDPVPTFKNIANDCLLSFVVSQRRRSTPYESRWYVMKRVDRQVRLEVDPPLLISDDVKIEFMTKPRLDFVGLNPKMWRKANKEFHFWLNTFFVDAEMDGGLAHDILTRDQPTWSSATANSSALNSEPATAWVDGSNNSQYNPFFNVSLSNRRQAAPEEEDPSDEIVMFTDDVTHEKVVKYTVTSNVTHQENARPHIFSDMGRRLSEQGAVESPMITLESDLDPDVRHLILPPHHQTVVSMASLMDGAKVTSVSELMKQFALKEDQQQAEKNGANNGQTSGGPHVHLVSNMSNASSSSSSSVSLAANTGGSTPIPLSVPPPTNTSFIEKRTRHASVPQTSSSPGAMAHLLSHHGSGVKKQGHNSAQKTSGNQSPQSHRTISIDGANIALRLNKSQIDKAAKDKQCKTFGEKFNVTLFFTKPTDQSDNLVDYSMQQESASSGENHRHITVTPVTLSSSTASMTTSTPTASSGAENHKNLLKSEQHSKKLGGAKSKGFKRPDQKSRMSLMHFGRKAESSSEEEPECCAPAEPGVPPARLQAITFAPSERDRNFTEEERLTFRDPLPPVLFPEHPDRRRERSKTRGEGKANKRPPFTQSDWI